MTIRHDLLTDPVLHEPKGIATASANEVYVANGTGSGTWTDTLDLTALEVDDLTITGDLDVAGTITGATLVATTALTSVDATVTDVLTAKEIILSDTAWDDYVVPLVSVTIPAGISGPGYTKINDNGSGSTGVYACAFDATSEESLVFAIQLPHRYKAGTALKPHVHWGATTAAAGNVVWGLEYCVSNVDIVASATTIITVTDATPEATKKQQIAAFSDIAGTGIKESSIINCRFFRKAGDAADTYAADAVAMSFDIHFEVEKLGTSNEYPA